MQISELVRQAQTGDAQAFAALYTQTRAKVFARCMYMLRDKSDAEDLTQEVFMKVHQKIGTFHGDSEFSTWLHKVTTTTVLMHLRAKKPDMPSLDELQSEPLDTTEAPEGEVSEALVNLPPRYREITRLRWQEGYSVEEVARMVGRKPMAIVRATTAARELLKKHLSQPKRTTERLIQTCSS